ncbi:MULTISPECIES: sigma-70 family RNA polymerase sigma factor [Pseudoalteromonas]|uniref:RNA polymerase subunit sigma-70 n=1 Tax=Pseudoalteromonas amylolytica TaxID=1859457 RepID=A0A1S1MR96_9GAMM|nr:MULTISPECIES: sigma-70 family RNA polymerase sigma factor [Pseudoalteromonas]OHU86255.1 RNA polymerase subunit sigma-70 [Pseudoalteromonas sp. JW3]OHU89640.1 RNA polymerase subunit sigma-70 [Pseudoalteromonas amylolytica]
MEHEQHLKLLRATALGDKQAFSQLYQATCAQLYAVSFKMLKNKALSEEALQEAYVRIWHNASEYQLGKGTVLTWMISIVRYRTLDLIRYQSVRNEHALEQDADDIATLNVSAFEHSDTTPLKMEECMDELDSEQKQAIHFAYFNGLSHQEVSASMGSPLGSIKSWIRRGLQSLQRCLSI